MPGLRDILEAATPGEWVVDPPMTTLVRFPPGVDRPALIRSMPTEADARLIALAPELAALVLEMGEALTTLNTMAAHSDSATGFLIESGIELNALLARLDRIGKEPTP